VLCVCLAWASGARAQQQDDAAMARTLYDRGMAHFRLEEYDQAIQKWEEGFRKRPVPEFLYNIAQAYRLSKRNEKARSFYKKYLLMDPEAPNKAQVQKHIAALDKAIDAEQRASSAPPSEPMPRPATTGSTPSHREPTPPTETRPTEPAPAVATPAPTTPVATPTPEPAAASSTTTSSNELVATAPHRDERPVYKKPWFWGVIGGGVVVIGAAVLVGVLVSSSGNGRDTIPAARF